METLLDIQDVSVGFRMYGKEAQQHVLQVLSHMYLSVHPKEIVAVVGSSGSGKSVLASGVLGLLPKNGIVQGTMYFKGEKITPSSLTQIRRKGIALVPQSVSCLDPSLRIEKQLPDGKNPIPLFSRLQLSSEVLNMYPYALSGGMARRVLVACSLLKESDVILADEPTPGMSREQALETLTLFREYAEEGKGVVLITHDLDLAVHFADTIAVCYAGTLLEVTPARSFLSAALKHPYSKALWNALPQNGFTDLKGTQPYAGNLPQGCVFADRCPIAEKKCFETEPSFNGKVRCHYGS